MILTLREIAGCSWIDAWRIPWHLATDMIAASIRQSRMARGEQVDNGMIDTDTLIQLPNGKYVHPSFAQFYKMLGRAPGKTHE